MPRKESLQYKKQTHSKSSDSKPDVLLETLAKLRQRNRVLPFKFAEQLWFADGRHVLYWPAQETLIVSDLHFGKGQSLNRYGNFIPTLDTASTLNVLEQVINDYTPGHLIALGDSFHDKYVSLRMSEADTHHLEQLCKCVPRWSWILGNHDDDIPQIWPGHYQSRLALMGIHFVHEPESDLPLQIVGHYHPRYKARLKGTSVSGRCFVRDNRTLIMPSFGSYTGGLAIEDDAIKTVFSDAISGIYLCHQQQVFSIEPHF